MTAEYRTIPSRMWGRTIIIQNKGQWSLPQYQQHHQLFPSVVINGSISRVINNNKTAISYATNIITIIIISSQQHHHQAYTLSRYNIDSLYF
jgi:hypothetical protein